MLFTKKKRKSDNKLRKNMDFKRERVMNEFTQKPTHKTVDSGKLLGEPLVKVRRRAGLEAPINKNEEPFI